MVHPSGTYLSERATVWTVTRVIETPRIIGTALTAAFNALKVQEPFVTKFIIKRVLQNHIANGQFVIQFKDHPP